ncbi:hypothetical protein ANN_03287 [Periplaneta americana]|uniref:Mariner Mos1 transposase n=1 Tax=Periplaneta americana TaxID=6978 RepID=A0ABQ8TYP8_PERAM|nr:hypothetical protein ANN_03287 [Periplaneta americana]
MCSLEKSGTRRDDSRAGWWVDEDLAYLWLQFPCRSSFSRSPGRGVSGVLPLPRCYMRVPRVRCLRSLHQAPPLARNLRFPPVLTIYPVGQDACLHPLRGDVLFATVPGLPAFRNISARIHSLRALPRALRHLGRGFRMDPVLLGHLGGLHKRRSLSAAAHSERESRLTAPRKVFVLVSWRRLSDHDRHSPGDVDLRLAYRNIITVFLNNDARRLFAELTSKLVPVSVSNLNIMTPQHNVTPAPVAIGPDVRRGGFFGSLIFRQVAVFVIRHYGLRIFNCSRKHEGIGKNGTSTWTATTSTEGQPYILRYPGSYWVEGKPPKNPQTRLKRTAIPSLKLTAPSSENMGQKGLLLVDTMPHGTTINSDGYVANLKKLLVRLSRVRRHREKQDVLLLHDNVQPYVSHKTTDQIRKFG